MTVDVSRLRDLLSRATPGEWVVLHESVWHERGHDQPATVAWVADWCVARSGPSYEFHGENQDDARLIAAAKNSMGALLDAYEERERLRTALQSMISAWEGKSGMGTLYEMRHAIYDAREALKEPSNA